MRAAAVIAQMKHRGLERWTWVVVTVYGVTLEAMYLSALGLEKVRFHDILYPFLCGAAYFVFGPAGWQFTGDDRRKPGFLRGLLQSMLWCGFLYVLCLPVPGGDEAPIWMRWLSAEGWPDWMRWLNATEWTRMLVFTWFVAKWEETRASYQEAAGRAREAQGTLLRSQLSPHFLFNALSAFAELGRRDWPSTERGLRSLSRIFERLVELSERDVVPLGDERRLIEDLLSIESLRLGERLRVRWDWDPGADAVRAPSLLLLPLVENALKHGLKHSVEGGEITIAGAIQDGRVRLEVANTGPWSEPSPGSAGVGLKNLQARLRLSYQERASFSLDREGSWTRAVILLPT
ncbi:MAG: histidine kinase [Acidobacteria bacterium]|nr:histidine kinase [Acidobacteriota bacterium]